MYSNKEQDSSNKKIVILNKLKIFSGDVRPDTHVVAHNTWAKGADQLKDSSNCINNLQEIQCARVLETKVRLHYKNRTYRSKNRVCFPVRNYIYAREKTSFQASRNKNLQLPPQQLSSPTDPSFHTHP